MHRDHLVNSGDYPRIGPAESQETLSVNRSED